jgi:hypothetical protein
VTVQAAVLDEKAIALELIGHYATVMGPQFMPFLEGVANLAVSLLSCYYYDGIRKAAARLTPVLLEITAASASSREQVLPLWHFLRRALLGAIEDEESAEVLTCSLAAFRECVNPLVALWPLDEAGIPSCAVDPQPARRQEADDDNGNYNTGNSNGNETAGELFAGTGLRGTTDTGPDDSGDSGDTMFLFPGRDLRRAIALFEELMSDSRDRLDHIAEIMGEGSGDAHGHGDHGSQLQQQQQQQQQQQAGPGDELARSADEEDVAKYAEDLATSERALAFQVSEFLCAHIRVLGAAFFPYLDLVADELVAMLGGGGDGGGLTGGPTAGPQGTETLVALSVFADLAEVTTTAAQRYHAAFVPRVADSLGARDVAVRQAAAYALGWVAVGAAGAAGDLDPLWPAMLRELEPGLAERIRTRAAAGGGFRWVEDDSHPDSVRAQWIDTAAVSAGRVCRFQSDKIDVTVHVPVFLEALPLESSADDGPACYGYMCDFLESGAPFVEPLIPHCVRVAAALVARPKFTTQAVLARVLVWCGSLPPQVRAAALEAFPPEDAAALEAGIAEIQSVASQQQQQQQQQVY